MIKIQPEILNMTEEEQEAIYNKFKQKIDAQISTIQAHYPNYSVSLFVRPSGYMVLLSAYLNGEKSIVGYNDNGKAIYTQPLRKAEREKIWANYQLYKIF